VKRNKIFRVLPSPSIYRMGCVEFNISPGVTTSKIFLKHLLSKQKMWHDEYNHDCSKMKRISTDAFRKKLRVFKSLCRVIKNRRYSGLMSVKFYSSQMENRLKKMCLFFNYWRRRTLFIRKLHKISNALNQEMLRFLLTSKPLPFKSLLSKPIFEDC
jgi:hypothetical protein